MTLKVRTLPEDSYYRKYYWDLRKVAENCTRCSTCKWIDALEVKSTRFATICPSSSYYLFDAYSCQGRMDVALALIEGRLKYADSPGLLDIMYRCNLCGGCDAMCKRVQDMEPLKVMQEMRASLVGDGELLPQHLLLMENLRREDNMMMKAKAGRGKWTSGLGLKDLTTEKADVVFHAGCMLDFDEGLWKASRASVALLEKAGVDFGVMGQDETCCGGRACEMGYHGEFIKYAENNLEAWSNAGVRTVVTSCADCYHTFKRLYTELGSSFEVLHIVELVDRLIKEDRLKFSRTIPMNVTYHDPCHLGRRSNIYVPGEPIIGVYEPPRDVIRAIPGMELMEMERTRECAWCCGAGGGVRESYPDFSMWTARERVAEAKTTGAEAIVTACPWCERNLLDAINKNGETMPVYDVTELAAQAI
ncbi:MAG: (Fe-S)-binding protein [Chloroflexota bacterium]